MHKLTIYGGNDKYGNPEGIQRLDLFRGELYTIVGNTGSGKSRLIKDIEQLANEIKLCGLMENLTVVKVFMGGAPATVIAFCCAFRTEYALHVGYNRRGFFKFTRMLQSKANQFR